MVRLQSSIHASSYSPSSLRLATFCAARDAAHARGQSASEHADSAWWTAVSARSTSTSASAGRIRVSRLRPSSQPLASAVRTFDSNAASASAGSRGGSCDQTASISSARSTGRSRLRTR